MSLNDYCTRTEQSCGVTKAVRLIGQKWTLLILRDLMSGPKRFGELASSLEGISTRTLTLRLQSLEKDGLIERVTHSTVPQPHYELTKRGLDFGKVIENLRAWGNSD